MSTDTAETAVQPLEVTPNTGAPTAVSRYWHLGDRDWLSVPAHGNQPTAAQLASFGYQAATAPQFYASLVGNAGMVANYRWWHPADKDWVDVPAGSISDAQMTANGYINKTFQYFAYPTQVAGTVAINRWWHPGDRDWLTLRQGEISDAQMTSYGYQNKTFLFFAFPERTQSSQIGYFTLGTPQKSVLSPAPWSESGDHPHTFSVLEVNPTMSPTINQGFRYLGYYGHHNCSGIGIARTNDLNSAAWTQAATGLFTNSGERWASALKNPDNTIGIVHNVFYCGGNPDGGRYYIVGHKSTDGLNGTAFTTRVPIVKEQTVENGNPTLFRDPADGTVYLYWFRNLPGQFQIRVKSAASFDALLATDPADIGTLIAFSPEVVASPQVMKVGNVYYLAVETREQSVWKTRVLTSTSPTGPFFELADGPVYGNNSACVFQHVFGTTLHTWYGNEGAPNTENWTLDHVSAPLT